MRCRGRFCPSIQIGSKVLPTRDKSENVRPTDKERFQAFLPFQVALPTVLLAERAVTPGAVFHAGNQAGVRGVIQARKNATEHAM